MKRRYARESVLLGRRHSLTFVRDKLPAFHLGHVEAIVLLEPHLHEIITDQLDGHFGRLLQRCRQGNELLTSCSELEDHMRGR
jgi:hypothetical protein